MKGSSSTISIRVPSCASEGLTLKRQEQASAGGPSEAPLLQATAVQGPMRSASATRRTKAAVWKPGVPKVPLGRGTPPRCHRTWPPDRHGKTTLTREKQIRKEKEKEEEKSGDHPEKERSAPSLGPRQNKSR